MMLTLGMLNVAIISWSELGRCRFEGGDFLAEIGEGGLVEDEFVGDFDQDFVAEKQGYYFLSAQLVDLHSG